MKSVHVGLLAGALVSVAALLWLRPAWFQPASPPPNIVVVLIDTLRADHLGAYGYARSTSPSIDALAARGTVFTSAYSVSNWTNPAIKSIFTGRAPQAVMPEAWHDQAITMPLPEELPTFAELLRARGYRTAALVDHPGIKPWGHFDKGFDQYTMLYEEGAGDRGPWGKADIDYVARQFEERLDAFGDDSFLVYLHVVYPHRPYQAPEAYRGLFGPDTYDDYDAEWVDALVNAYDAEIRRTDDLVSLLDNALAARGLIEKTWIVLVADHGEAFWEHGFAEHGNAFYNEAIRIPLILVPPAGQPRDAERVDTPVSNLDVYATILDIAGAPAPRATAGFSLAAGGSGRRQTSRILYSESAHSHDIDARTVIRDGLKYTFSPGLPESDQHLLFDLRADPAERENLHGMRPALEADLRDLIETHRRRSAQEREQLSQEIVVPDAETLERLRALGYIR